MSTKSPNPNVIRIKPMHYVHVLDNNSSVTRVEVGPKTLTRQDHELVVFGPEPMISVPLRHFCVVANPVVRDAGGEPQKDKHGQFKLKTGDQEVRFEQEPFPLFPGEKLVENVQQLSVVPPNTALRLKAQRNFDDKNAGDEWLFKGPATYIPRVEVKVLETVNAIPIGPNQALKLRARLEMTDAHGKNRKVGEEWLVRTEGAYLPSVHEELVELVDAFIITDKKALHLRAIRTFTDSFGKEHKAGEEWLVTYHVCDIYIPDVYEAVVGEVPITTLTSRQYCVVLDPVDPDTLKPRLGQRVVRKGECSFFLNPGERLEKGIQSVIVLSEDEALLLRALVDCVHVDKAGTEVKHVPGDRWMIYGACEYVPPVEVEIVEQRKRIPLDESEGIYVRDIKTGKVRAVVGSSYMLMPTEELWEKDLPKEVEDLLNVDALSDRAKVASGVKSVHSARVKTKLVTYRVPHNAAVQIYDYKNKRARVVFGPDLVMLDPDEHFTVLKLSGGKPKKPGVIDCLSLLLGPDFMTDIVIVETSDHARLQLQLSYNWEFRINKTSPEEVAGIFQVPDFVGDACQSIASRVRGVVASTPFHQFHQYSSKIIRTAIFGVNDKGKIRDEFTFKANNLVITNIDIQSVEPVDQRTRDSLQKSVQLAIEITTKSQEASAKHEADRLEQEAKGKLERQRIQDESLIEEERRHMLELAGKSIEVEATGKAAAEAHSRAKAAEIAGSAAVEVARLKAKATEVESQTDLQLTMMRQQEEILHAQALVNLEIEKAKEQARTESAKFGKIVTSIGPQTIKAIAQAGPELQVKLLQSLGLQGYMVTNSSSPINLFGTAQGFVSGMTKNTPKTDDAASIISE
jgi:major vault protein